MEVAPWTPANESAALHFLQSRYEKSMFLLGNREAVGTSLGDHPNSGNFKVLSTGDQIVGVFSLTRRGNLLLSIDDGEVTPASVGAIVDGARAEGLAIKGVSGPWEGAEAVYSQLQSLGLMTRASFHSQEILYRLQLDPARHSVDRDPNCRLFALSDFEAWKPLRLAYLKEEGLSQELTPAQLLATFTTTVERGSGWCYLIEENQMVAMVGLNARAMDIGQVGGVYTVPGERKKGLAGRAMRTMMADCWRTHGLRRMILFTGQQNVAAQRLYESLGFERIGFFGLIFS